jgi:hypothetical protein
MKVVRRIGLKPLVLACVLFVFLCHTTFAGFYDGNWLVKGWREYQKLVTSTPGAEGRGPAMIQATVFIGYVAGVADTLDGTVFALPGGLTIDQMCQVVGKYLENTPERWTESAHLLVADALKAAFGKKE